MTIGMTMTISCDDCTMRRTSTCSGCVVTFLCGRDPGEPVAFDAEEARAVGMLSRAGLTPPLLHRSRHRVF